MVYPWDVRFIGGGPVCHYAADGDATLCLARKPRGNLFRAGWDGITCWDFETGPPCSPHQRVSRDVIMEGLSKTEARGQSRRSRSNAPRVHIHVNRHVTPEGAQPSFLSLRRKVHVSV